MYCLHYSRYTVLSEIVDETNDIRIEQLETVVDVAKIQCTVDSINNHLRKTPNGDRKATSAVMQMHTIARCFALIVTL